MRLLCPTPENFSERVQIDARKLLDARFMAMDQREFDRIAPEYDAVMVRFNTRVGGKLMGGQSRLKAVLSPTTGLDHIDLDAAQRYGVRLFHLRDQRRLLSSVSATAELTVALMLALMRRLPEAVESVRNRSWQTSKFRGHELAGKTIGIVGYGRLGRKVARTATALGMNVIAYDVKRLAMPSHVRRGRTVDELLRASDIVTLHVPLGPETEGLIGKREIARMKRGAILLNTARALIVDQAALLAALRSGRLSGAAVDVLEGEHSIGGRAHPMIEYARSHPNLLITPHIGGATEESIEKTDLNVLGRYLKWIGRKVKA